VRSSLREAGNALIAELIRQCDEGGPGRGTEIASSFHVAAGIDGRVLTEPMPMRRRQTRRQLQPA
jgi:hypothetical protein